MLVPYRLARVFVPRNSDKVRVVMTELDSLPGACRFSPERARDLGACLTYTNTKVSCCTNSETTERQCKPTRTEHGRQIARRLNWTTDER